MLWWLLSTVLSTVLYYGFILLIIVQLVRLVVADADLTLLYKEKYGLKPDVLRGNVVWITGASSGIGEHLAYQFAKVGCKLILTARREEELNRVKEQCLVYGPVTKDDIMVLPLDILEFERHKECTDQILKRFGKLDMLVNNAARSQRAWLKDTAVEVDRQMFELVVLAQISLTKAVLPHFLQRKKGQVLVTSSIAGKVGAPFSATYTSCKHAIQGFFEAMRMEHANDNIDITLACPGPVFSNINQEAFTEEVGKKHGIKQETTDKRMTGERCAELMVIAAANKLGEVWITRQPVLLFTYVSQSMPDIGRWIGKRVGMKTATKLREGK